MSAAAESSGTGQAIKALLADAPHASAEPPATERSPSSWIAVRIGQRALLVPLSHASEIVPWQRPSPVPFSQSWFTGVVNWRGELFGVVDLSVFLDAASPHRPEQALAQSRLLTFNPVLETNAALWVDHMAGLRGLVDFERAHAPASGTPRFLGNLYTDRAGDTWQELNLQYLSQDKRFLSIGH